ncbi:MAG: glycoside hydrolase family 28 protein [Oscillospiraceae bacterium]|nr:glycoside hydrolase family 28 protein [Oscillospiraceae bacterium]
MLNVLYAGSTSACFELQNENPYYAPEAFTIYLNDEKQRACDANVFSLFSLTPDTDYVLRVEGAALHETLRFRTAKESCAIDVRDFGATGDGVTDDTDAIQTAIGCLPAYGRLYFPAGCYLSRPLMLKSHITLELAEGATLLGCPDRTRYNVIPGTVRDLNGGADVHFGGFEGNAMPLYQSLLTAQYAEDIAIVGRGKVDGNGQNTDFWTAFRTFAPARARLMFFNRCKNVVVHGVHACNSPSWQIHPYYSEQVALYDLLISAPKNSPNTDAIDPESCDGVDIIGCRFTVGDDCIAIKSGKIELGSTLNRPADHHTIRNCLMEFGHGAVVLGSEIGAGVRNLSVTQCYFRGTDRGLRIKSRRGRGKNCIIDNVSFDNIRMDGVLTPIAINLWYNCCDPDRESEYVWSREKLPVDERTPHMGRFHFKNLDCTGAEVAACYIDGLPEAPIDAVTLENIRVSFAADAKPGVPIMENFAKKRCRLGLYLDNVRRIRVDNVQLDGVDGEKLIANHYDSIETTNFED